jgi:hypothetical protein
MISACWFGSAVFLDHLIVVANIIHRAALASNGRRSINRLEVRHCRNASDALR